MHFGRFHIDRERLVLDFDGEPLDLAPKSVAFLAALVERAGQVVSKSDLLDLLWPESAVAEANLTQHIHIIRKALRACDPAAAGTIVTVPKCGYRFVAPARMPAQPVEIRNATSAPARMPVQPLENRNATAAEARPIRNRVAQGWFRPGAIAALVAILAGLGGLGGLGGFGGFGLHGGIDGLGIVRIVQPSSPAATTLSAAGAQRARLGRYYLDLRTATSVRRSRLYFASVIQSDPGSPTGYAGLADAFSITSDYRFGSLPRSAYLRRAAALATQAVRLDPRSAEAHASLGAVALFQRDRQNAERELRHAIALDPNYAPAHHWLGALRFEEGDFPGSVRELEIALQSNPVSTASSAWLETASYLVRRYDTAIDYGRRTIEFDPSRHDSLRELGLAYAATGRYTAALATFRRIPEGANAHASVPFLLASVYARAGRAELARRILEHERRLHVTDTELPFALLALGKTQEAARAVGRLRFTDCGDHRVFVGDPRFDAVRKDAAFATLFHASCRERV